MLNSSALPQGSSCLSLPAYLIPLLSFRRVWFLKHLSPSMESRLCFLLGCWSTESFQLPESSTFSSSCRSAKQQLSHSWSTDKLLDLVKEFSGSKTPKLVRKQPASLFYFVGPMGSKFTEYQKAPAEASLGSFELAQWRNQGLQGQRTHVQGEHPQFWF